jgi:hypothetical protein
MGLLGQLSHEYGIAPGSCELVPELLRVLVDKYIRLRGFLPKTVHSADRLVKILRSGWNAGIQHSAKML